MAAEDGGDPGDRAFRRPLIVACVTVADTSRDLDRGRSRVMAAGDE
jgi:hypothetical protein